MEYIRSLIHGDHGHNAEAKSRSSSRDGSKMEITTPKGGDIAFGDLPTPVAPPTAAPPPQQQKSSSRPPLSNSKPSADKKLDSWKVGPRYSVSSILGKGSYGEVAGGIDTVT
jgi:hypothetical protein